MAFAFDRLSSGVLELVWGNSLAKVRGTTITYPSERRQSVNLSASGTHDMLCAYTSDQQRVSDERTMTPPRHGFGAHERNLVLVRQLDQFCETLHIYRRLHVVRVASKGSIAPAQVDRIELRMTQAAQSRQMNVAKAGFLQ